MPPHCDSPQCPRASPPTSAAGAISRFNRWTVPVPRPASLAVLPIPVPLASSWRARSILSGSAPGRPRLRRTMPALLVNFSPRNPRLDGRQPRLDALTDHRALEFAKGSCDLEGQLGSGRGRVEVLLLQIEIHTYRLEMLDGAEKVNQRPPKPIDRPGHHHIETPPTGVVEHRVKPWALISALGATDA